MIIAAIPAHVAIVAPYQEKKPKVIYFDFGGVVARPDSQMQLDYLVETLGFPKEAIQDSPYYRWMQLHPFEIEYLSQKATEYKIPLDPESLERYREVKRESVREIPGMSELVSTLRQMNYEVNLITNVRAENLDLIEPFKGLFDHVVHCPKDPGEREAVWEIERVRNGFQASRLMLIDDQEENVEEAQKLGIQAIQFQNAEDLIAELSRRAILFSPEK